MNTGDFDYYLPEESIAQTPSEPRDSSRLLILDRQKMHLEQRIFRQIGEYLRPNDVLVANQTRVIPARLPGRKLPGGGKVELLLLKRLDDQHWEALVGGKGMKTGRQILLGGHLQAEITAVLDGPRRVVHFSQPIEALFGQIGHMPLPPYIHMPLANPERYQTVYASRPGSAAAPTAGLHFTQSLIDNLKANGVQFTMVTLHVGLDTFAPVTEEDALEHKIHTEWCEVTPETAKTINSARQAGGRVIAVGTTSVRTLESAAGSQGVEPFEGPTGLYILPGYQFKIVDGMITNFHLPRSTLIMLVSAFAGRERILSAYRQALDWGFRFYSFGDAMLIV